METSRRTFMGLTTAGLIHLSTNPLAHAAGQNGANSFDSPGSRKRTYKSRLAEELSQFFVWKLLRPAAHGFSIIAGNQR